ncbi:hypothetical protein EZV73_04780 [Acidaminobacter sp. JC074]|uniref:hypothetical protein n=1 Tax=Acidaminobacter sp. JC074 TaxID=2530199 RepID=UPI001F0CE797|nr:hypothetical protein [Acidaminobacter sp. JC074]MCH4886869.1 hypothetical protein [Acidaminobacter sp. JC074]
MFDSKPKTIFVIILVCVLAFYVGGKYKTKVHYNKDSQYIINDLYISCHHLIDDIEYIEEKVINDPDNHEAINHSYQSLVKELNELESNLHLSRKLMSKYNKDDIGVLSNMEFSLHHIRLILGGVNTNDVTISHDFLEDGILTSEEVTLLSKIKGEFVEIVDELMDESGQADQSITMTQLKNVLEPFTNDFIESIIYEPINNW